MNIESIWAQYHQSLKAFLHSKISNSAEVDDLLQEILLKTLKHGHKLPADESIKAWLFKIASNTIIDHYRKNARNREIDAEQLWYTTDEDEIRQSLIKCIIPFINALPEESAELLTAIDMEGQSQKAYAKQIGVTYSTLKSRVQKARKDLRDLFEQCCIFELDKNGNLIDFDAKPTHCERC